MSINGKQVNWQNNANNSVISTILRQNNYRQLTASLHPHAQTVTFARWQRLPTEVSGCGQLADGLKMGRRDISMF